MPWFWNWLVAAQGLCQTKGNYRRAGVSVSPTWHLHNGTHSSAVALPHATEAGLSPDVPELSKKRGDVSPAGGPQIHPGSHVSPHSFQLQHPQSGMASPTELPNCGSGFSLCQSLLGLSLSSVVSQVLPRTSSIASSS